MNKSKVIKWLKNNVKGWDDFKASIDKKPSKEIEITIFNEGKIEHLRCYPHQDSLNLWINHFEEYFESGTFDKHCYWVAYNHFNGEMDVYDKVIFQIPVFHKRMFNNDFYEYSYEHSAFMDWFKETFDKSVGFKKIPKPQGMKNVVLWKDLKVRENFNLEKIKKSYER